LVGIAATLLLSTVISACAGPIIIPGPPPPANSPVKADKRVVDTVELQEGLFAVLFEAVLSFPAARSRVVLTDTLTNVRGPALILLPEPYDQTNPSGGRLVAKKDLGDLPAGTYTVHYGAFIAQQAPNCFNTYSNDITITDRNGFVVRDTVSFTLRGCGKFSIPPTGDVVPADYAEWLSSRISFEDIGLTQQQDQVPVDR
jgi:hypothetical protein